MKFIITLFTTTLFLTGLVIQSNFAQVRELDAYSKLKVGGSVEVYLVKSNQNKAEIQMIRGDAEDLMTEVKNDILLIKFKDRLAFSGGNQSKAKITLHYKELKSIDAGAGSRVVSKEEIASHQMSIDVSSGASCALVIKSNDCKVNISSGGSCSVSGSTINSNVQVSSGASFNGSDLKSDMVKVSASSGASAKVWAMEKIIGNASSGGSIRFKGEPKEKILDSGKYSGGSIRNM
ncbi:MAG TPA: DUF2807 domain-containing protein [Saprospiraceae bacterium]|nr:DUF2807 domain-containing protein [Saprospiraceae bacterium]